MKLISVLMLMVSICFGAYIAPRNVQWNEVTDLEMASFRLYYSQTDSVLTRENDFILLDKSVLIYDLNQLGISGNVHIGLASVDTLNNESDIVLHYNNPFLLKTTPPTSPVWK